MTSKIIRVRIEAPIKFDCNDLFSRFEQQILFLEKQAETTEPTTDRHEHDGPSKGVSFQNT